MRTVVADRADSPEESDHLYLMTASQFLDGLVKIGRSQCPAERACQLQNGMPYHMCVRVVFNGVGPREREVHTALRCFRVENTPGTEWYQLSLDAAYRAIGKVLFEPDLECKME